MNKVVEHLGSKYPIIQAPMGWIARSKLASAVSNAGGFGIIETSSGEVDICKEEIKKMAELTDKPFGVNLPLLFLSDSTMVDFIVEHGVNFVTTSAGDPGKYIDVMKSADITVYHAVPRLAKVLKNDDWYVHTEVVKALGYIVSNKPALVKPHLALIENRTKTGADRRICDAAKWALKKAGG